MSLLRIYGSLAAPPDRGLWRLFGGNNGTVSGEGPLTELPGHAHRVQLVLPASDVLLIRTHLPANAGRRTSGAVLAYAIEDQIAGDPENNRVIRIGDAGDDAVLAVMNRRGLQHWRDALAAAGIRRFEIHCETLLLPWRSGTWSLAWNGREGYLRSSLHEGGATDCGDRDTPPMSLQLLLDSARRDGTAPAVLAVYSDAGAAPDAGAWTQKLGLPVQRSGAADWQTAAIDAGISLSQERGHWQAWTGMARPLRPAAWIAGAALAIHALALGTHWMLLDIEQRALRQDMEARFRAVFPEAVAVVDPPLQMRRKLADARHAAGIPDESDFLPMIERTAAAMKTLPAGSVRIVSYESGRMTLELSPVTESVIRQLVTPLRQSGLELEIPSAPRAANAALTLTVRAP